MPRNAPCMSLDTNVLLGGCEGWLGMGHGGIPCEQKFLRLVAGHGAPKL